MELKLEKDNFRDVWKKGIDCICKMKGFFEGKVDDFLEILRDFG